MKDSNNKAGIMKVESKDADVKVLETDCLGSGGKYMPNVFLHPNEKKSGSIPSLQCNACLKVQGITF